MLCCVFRITCPRDIIILFRVGQMMCVCVCVAGRGVRGKVERGEWREVGSVRGRRIRKRGKVLKR